MIELRHYTHKRLFYYELKGYLEKKEAEYNLPLGLLLGSLEEPIGEGLQFSIFFHDRQAVGFIYEVEESILIGGEEICVELCFQELTQIGKEIVVMGSKTFVDNLAKMWVKNHHSSIQLIEAHWIYSCNQIRTIGLGVPGSMREAVESDLPILIDWLQEEAAESKRDFNPIIEEEKLVFLMMCGALYVWDDVEIRATARLARPTDHGIVLTGVYTPSHFRNNGYGGRLVEALTREALKDYMIVNLYVDKQNGVANRLYQRIGYQKVTESVKMKLVPLID